MKKHRRRLLFILSFSALVLLAILIMQPLEIYHFREYVTVLFPKGSIGIQERDLLLILQILMLLIIIPVYIFTFVFSWRYRAGNKKAKYDPNLVHNTVAEYVWWGVPLVLTIIFCIFTCVKTYELDPYKPIASDKATKTIQVVALQWKWLFIYPEEQLVTTNFVAFPEKTPIHFEITADAPMNSFWIPALGGQIYAMPNMKTELHLIADSSGDFNGLSANLSGEGFANMSFIARATSEEDYHAWVESAKLSKKSLDFKEYSKIADPNNNVSVEVYRLEEENLFCRIMAKYMYPQE